MRLIFFGDSPLALRALETLESGDVEIVGLVTHPVDSGGSAPVDLAGWALERGVPVEHVPPYRKFDDPAFLEGVPVEILLSVCFRAPLGPAWLERPRLGAFNLHPSLLPRYRGRSPVNWAILEGESLTGWTFHRMVEAIDAGEILARTEVPIGPEEPVREVLSRLEDRLPDVILEGLRRARAGERGEPQDADRATHRGGRGPDDGRLDVRWPVKRQFDLVRAVSEPFPGAFFEQEGGERILVWEARPRVGEGLDLRPGEARLLGEGRVGVRGLDGLLELLRVTGSDLRPLEPRDVLEALRGLPGGPGSGE